MSSNVTNFEEIAAELEAARHRIAELEHQAALLQDVHRDLESMESLRERLELALKSANLCVWEWMISTNQLTWDDCMYALYEVERDGEELTLENWKAMLHDDDRGRVWAECQAAIHGHRQFNGRFRIRTGPEGEITKYIRVHARCQYDHQGDPIKMVGINWDVTESVLADQRNALLQEQLQQAQKLEAVGTLAGGIAHDFNNMLGAIIGYTELAMRKIKDDQSQVSDMLNKSLAASHRARELVSQMLVFSRRGGGRESLINLSKTVSEALDFLRASLPSTITLEMNLSDVGLVEANPTQINQIIINLATNASQALPLQKGKICIRLGRFTMSENSAKPVLEPGEYLTIEIEDNGHGMPPEVLSRIFEPFFTTKEVGVGTGLGLSVVHGIVTSHQGAIEVESAPDRGAKFTIYWPAANSEPEVIDQPAKVEVRRGEGQHIVVVDDEQALVSMTKMLLEGSGFQVTAFHDSLIAQNYLAEHMDSVDLLITDQIMPNVMGSELLEFIRGKGAIIPVIITTGFGYKMDPAKVRALGRVEILRKPCSLNDILTAIDHGLND